MCIKSVICHTGKCLGGRLQKNIDLVDHVLQSGPRWLDDIAQRVASQHTQDLIPVNSFGPLLSPNSIALFVFNGGGLIFLPFLLLLLYLLSYKLCPKFHQPRLYRGKEDPDMISPFDTTRSVDSCLPAHGY